MGKMGVCGNSRSEAVQRGESPESRSTCAAAWESEDESLTGKKATTTGSKDATDPPLVIFNRAAEAKDQPNRFLNDSNASDSSRRMKDSLSKAVRSRNVA